MTHPRRYLIRMVAFLLVVGAVVVILSGGILPFFLSNPVLNGVILGVILLGIILNFRHVTSLFGEVAWIRSFRENNQDTGEIEPRLLGPMATMLKDMNSRSRERRGEAGRITLSAVALRSLLDGIGSRLSENRETSRYFVGLCVFLGLLGTFWGLLDTVGSIANVIGKLSIISDDVTTVFADLKTGLEAPLAGMGTAFSSSLFGLAGSLVLGFLDLQAGQAQNAFYNDLEDWLSGQTRLSSGGGVSGDGDQSVPAYITALLEKTADSLDDLQRTIARTEESGQATNTQIRRMAETMTTLTDQMRTEQAVLLKLAETQADLRPVLHQIAERMAAEGDPKAPAAGLDDAAKGHLRNMDAAVTYMANHFVSGREQTLKELRGEIKMLARTIAATAENRRDGM